LLRTVRRQIAVAQQHRKRFDIGVDGGRVAGHHVGPVEKVSDAPEAFRFTLREVAVLRRVEPHQLGVLLRADPAHGGQREALGHFVHRQPIGLGLVCASGERLAVDRNGLELELIAIQDQRAVARALRVAPHCGGALHQRVAIAYIDIELDSRYQKRGRGVVLQVNSVGDGVQHIRRSLKNRPEGAAGERSLRPPFHGIAGRSRPT